MFLFLLVALFASILGALVGVFRGYVIVGAAFCFNLWCSDWCFLKVFLLVEMFERFLCVLAYGVFCVVVVVVFGVVFFKGL